MKSLDTSTLQRESLPEEEEEELQMKSLDTSTLQRESLPEEEEEELQMKSLDNSTLQRESLPEEEEEELQMKSLDTSTLQRESLPEEEEELQMKPMVQRQAKGGMAANPDLEASINQARGSGQPMADNIREPMEQAFGADFSGVKVHTDGQSDELNQSIQARAFTTGQDVFFRQGEYNPGSRGGQELLAHELTHVVQQNGEAVQRSSQLTDTSSPPTMEISKQVKPAIQRITEEDAHQAVFTFGPRAQAHDYTAQQLKTIIQHRYNEIQEGEQQFMLLGDGFENNNRLYGQIIYNCTQENGIHHIRITHAHGRGRMG
uniref:DUF4157 domain-containing protein n=3 Tax=Desmonostoc muscorum TaxID=1179 RepID=A0A8J7DEL6_DESMC